VQLQPIPHKTPCKIGFRVEKEKGEKENGIGEKKEKKENKRRNLKEERGYLEPKQPIRGN
jgi:hypothetical protein